MTGLLLMLSFEARKRYDVLASRFVMVSRLGFSGRLLTAPWFAPSTPQPPRKHPDAGACQI